MVPIPYAARRLKCAARLDASVFEPRGANNLFSAKWGFGVA
jgi:hypothetical protein